MRDSGRVAAVPDVPPTVVADGACAVVLATGDRARELTSTPVWIRGLDHRIDPPGLGLRDLTRSASARLAGEQAGVGSSSVERAWLHVPYPHQELILREELGLDGVEVDTDEGPMMVAGLARFAAAAEAIAAGGVRRGAVHATSGTCLQQNLVAVLEGSAA